MQILILRIFRFDLPQEDFQILAFVDLLTKTNFFSIICIDMHRYQFEILSHRNPHKEILL